LVLPLARRHFHSFPFFRFSFFPILITLINYSFGKKLLRLLSGFKNEDERFQTILSLGLGFVAFFTVFVAI